MNLLDGSTVTIFALHSDGAWVIEKVDRFACFLIIMRHVWLHAITMDTGRDDSFGYDVVQEQQTWTGV